MPVHAVHFERDALSREQEVNAIAADLRFLPKPDPEGAELKPDGALNRSLSGPLTITRCRAVGRLRARLSLDVLAAPTTLHYYWWPTAEHGAVAKSPASCIKRLAAPGTTHRNDPEPLPWLFWLARLGRQVAGPGTERSRHIQVLPVRRVVESLTLAAVVAGVLPGVGVVTLPGAIDVAGLSARVDGGAAPQAGFHNPYFTKGHWPRKGN